jgi:N-formylglutamate amidohydrolase
MPADSSVFEFSRGCTPLLISVPHAGIRIPGVVAERLTPAARSLPDTDWLVDSLYEFALSCGAGVIAANYNRYLVDLNRPPDDASLYKSKSTGLFPLIDFSGEDIYLENLRPGDDERTERLNRYWQPYHYQLQSELDRLRLEHGHAVLLDAHSIAAEVPMLFSGVLPDFNLGSNDGTSAAPEVEGAAFNCLEIQPGFSAVLNGRFKGGYITRHYGSPADRVHALQLELSQSTYLAETPEKVIDPAKYARLRPVLKRLVETLQGWRPHA